MLETQMNAIIIRLSILIVGLAVSSHTALAAVPKTYTNDNFWSDSTTHDRPISFTVDEEGNVHGATETGKIFSQVNVPNEQGIRLQKFMIDEAFYYIYERGIIRADSDAAALKVAGEE